MTAPTKAQIALLSAAAARVLPEKALLRIALAEADADLTEEIQHVLGVVIWAKPKDWAAVCNAMIQTVATNTMQFGTGMGSA